MAPGAINQQIYARGLPPGVKMLITDVTFKIPSGDWWPTLSGRNHTITKNTSDEEKKRMLPMEVTQEYSDGYIGTAGLTSLSVFDTGAGPEIYLRFQLEGTTTSSSVEGTTNINLSGTQGFITLATTEWGYASRPDYCNVTYQLMDLAPRNLANQTPLMQSPKDVSFVLGANARDRQVGINASVDPDVTKDLIGYALQGIFTAHEKAAGWVVGKI